MSERVVVAMSGGVDSSVSAALLKQQGYEVVGVMMRIWGEPAGPNGAYNRCCSPDSIAQARRVAELLDIPFYVLDVQAPFKAKVVDFFVDSYLAGVTPNPCIECNRHIRWDYLLKRALAMEAHYLATGHYAQIKQVAGHYELHKGLDERKDQSYVLSVMTQTQLGQALFPVGGYAKPQVRQIARDLGLPVAEREESQDLCFIADDDYHRFVRERAPAGSIQPGPIVRRDGTVIGQHQGLPFYTIGQRKGIGIAGPEPLYVLGTQPATNALVVGPASELGQTYLETSPVNWLSGATPTTPLRAEVKIRYKAAPAWATISLLPNGGAAVQFDHPLRDITPGQAAVFYNGTQCLGGGIIQRASAAT